MYCIIVNCEKALKMIPDRQLELSVIRHAYIVVSCTLKSRYTFSSIVCLSVCRQLITLPGAVCTFVRPPGEPLTRRRGVPAAANADRGRTAFQFTHAALQIRANERASERLASGQLYLWEWQLD